MLIIRGSKNERINKANAYFLVLEFIVSNLALAISFSLTKSESLENLLSSGNVLNATVACLNFWKHYINIDE